MNTTVLFNPYNPNNKYIDREFLENLLGFKVHHLDVYQNSFSFINHIVKELNHIQQIKMVKK